MLCYPIQNWVGVWAGFAQLAKFMFGIKICMSITALNQGKSTRRALPIISCKCWNLPKTFCWKSRSSTSWQFARDLLISNIEVPKIFLFVVRKLGVGLEPSKIVVKWMTLMDIVINCFSFQLITAFNWLSKSYSLEREIKRLWCQGAWM